MNVSLKVAFERVLGSLSSGAQDLGLVAWLQIGPPSDSIHTMCSVGCVFFRSESQQGDIQKAW